MNLAEQIKAKQAEITAAKDQLTVVIKSLENVDAADTTAVEALDLQVKSLSETIEGHNARMATLLSAEKALAGTANAPAVIHQRGDHKDPAILIVRSALATQEAYLKRVPIAQVMAERYGNYNDFEQTKAVSEYIVAKAAQNPAFTNVAGYAQELTQQAYGAFMDLLTPESVVANLPMNSFQFEGFSSIVIPMRANRTKNFAGAFRAEGAPIRVGGTTLTSKTLTPKSMGIIGTFSQELFRRSTPNIETLIRQWMIEDTSIALDGTFLGATVGSATQPAGIAYGLGANTAVSSGNTQEQITADVRAMLQRMANAQLGRRPVWIMDPQRLIGLQTALTPTGTLAFPSAQNKVFMGYPIVTSLNVPDSEVFVVDAAEIDFAGGTPMFMGTEVATIHEEDTNPAEVGGSTTPVRSLFQTNSAALRAVWELDWLVQRSGAVQQLTSVAW